MEAREQNRDSVQNDIFQRESRIISHSCAENVEKQINENITVGDNGVTDWSKGGEFAIGARKHYICAENERALFIQ